MKKILLLAMISAPIPALAHVSCAGETYTGTIVNVTIDTTGTLGAVAQGQVTIKPKDEASRSYTLRREEITQFYESLDGDPARAIVGLNAFVDGEFPVQIRYVGTNFEGNLTQVLRDAGRHKEKGNALRAWKGPGFAGDQQHSFADVVCQVSLDP